MPLGTAVQAGFDNVPVKGNLTVRTTLRSSWVTIRDAGDMDVADAATITDPDAEITNATTHILKTGGRGETLILRMKYDDGNTSSTDAVVKVFGRHSSADTAWTLLENKAAAPAINVTMVTAETTDTSDGTDNWTRVSGTSVAFDLRGSDEIIVGVETAYAVSAGDAALASLEAKVF